MMKHWLIPIVFVFAFACRWERIIVDPPPNVEPDTTIKSGTSFGKCLGYCRKELEITATGMTLTRSGWNTKEYPPMSVWQEISRDEWQRLVQLIDQKMIAQIEDIYGCPDCADGGAEWIEVIQGDFSKKVTFEFGTTLEPIQPLLDEVRQIRAQLENLLPL
jgi:hypothetical protein